MQASAEERGDRPPADWQQHFYPHVLPTNGAMLSYLHGIGPPVSLGWCLAPEALSQELSSAAAVPFTPTAETPRTPGGGQPRGSMDIVRSGAFWNAWWHVWPHSSLQGSSLAILVPCSDEQPHVFGF